jgi:hypothetical protein
MAGTSTVGSEELNALLGHVALLSVRRMNCRSDRGDAEVTFSILQHLNGSSIGSGDQAAICAVPFFLNVL